MQFVKSVLSAVGIGICVYVLTLTLAGVLTWPQYSGGVSDAHHGVGGNVDTAVIGEVNAVLDVPDAVAPGVPFAYSIARSTYGEQGVRGVKMEFSDGTVLDYTTGHAPNQGEHVFVDVGRHTVTLTIIDVDGVAHTDTRVVMVQDAGVHGSQEPQTVLV